MREATDGFIDLSVRAETGFAKMGRDGRWLDVLRFKWLRQVTAATLACYLGCVLLVAGQGHGVRFASWDGPPNGGSITKGAPFGQIVNAFGDYAGRLRVLRLRGIVHLKGRVVTSQFEFEGLRSIQNIAKDNDGSLWIVPGNNTISDLSLCQVTDRAVKCFGREGGIPSYPLNALLAHSKGGFWIGGQTTLVDWHDSAPGRYPVEALKSNLGQFGIAGLAHGPDGSLWVGILAPGKYRFRVMAANSDGIWNETAAKLDFSVAPAYYQTTWFRTLSAAVFLGLVWVVCQWRSPQLHLQSEAALEARLGERTRIARELHDTLLQSAHGLLLRFQTVANFITEARDEVQGLRDSITEGNNLALAISALGQALANEANNAASPQFQVTVEGTLQDLRPIIRDEVYKITAEALRNVFQHAQAGRIEVEIRYGKEEFRLRVRDDGKGIDPTILARQGREGHYGLHGMRERATAVGGKLTVWSEIDTGTEVELRVPVSAYATARKRFWLFR